MEFKTKRGISALLTGIGALALCSAASAQQGFNVELVTRGINSPKGITGANCLAPQGLMENYLYVAESGMDRILKISPEGSLVDVFATPMSSFPVGIACFGQSFAQDLYVGNATSTGGLDKGR